MGYMYVAFSTQAEHHQAYDGFSERVRREDRAHQTEPDDICGRYRLVTATDNPVVMADDASEGNASV